MGLINRVKSWLLPQKARHDSLATILPNNGTAVAGFIQRASSEVEIITSSNMARPLAVLMPPSVAAATPLRTIPLFLVPASVEPAEVEIIQNARPAPKLQLVHSSERAVWTAQPASTFMLAARLASVAEFNTVAGKKPCKQPSRQSATTQAKARAKVTNRPSTTKPTSTKVAAVSASQNCFVRPQTTGKAVVVSVPKRAKPRTS
jgi:hypothetical protein